jgi:hypothetical protein
MIGRNNDTHLRIDHAVIAGRDLEKIDSAFESVGMDPDYAGKLDNDVNHLSQLGFPDGSYFELTATLEPGMESPWWDVHFQQNAGPTAWAVEPEDIGDEARRLEDRGIAVDGPMEFGRERPDGTYFEYELVLVGDKEFGTQLPFLIRDHTPRSNRCSTPSNSVADTELRGIAMVVVGVEDLESVGELYEDAFDLPEPVTGTDTAFGARLAHYEETPVTLATPDTGGEWLTDRLATYDECPCAYLLGTDDWERTAERFDLVGETEWFGYRIAWIDSPEFDDINLRLGVLGE